MVNILLVGDITISEVEETLGKYFPQKSVKVLPADDGVDNAILSELDKLKKLVALQERDRTDMEASLLSNAQAIQKLHQQQRALFDEFSILRNKYDNLKTNAHELLWNRCCGSHPELDQIPYLEDDTNVESEEKVGNYEIGDMIGEGQFATVWNCTKHDSEQIYAIKRITKDKITTFNELRNISNEISILRSLDSKFIIGLIDTIHTKNNLYIITEKGGPDLFEFFEDRAAGNIDESWAKDIISQIVAGVTYCHLQDICHRDLKPENILIKFNYELGVCEELKLCDFGLGTKFSNRSTLTDFCGSPGFFAPEMLIKGEYYGDKVDVWSIGCIILELMLGHDLFYTYWMHAYDYEILHNKIAFEKRITIAVKNLQTVLKFSDSLNQLISQFLIYDPEERPHLWTLCQHSWLIDKMPEDIIYEAKYKETIMMNKQPTGSRSSFSSINGLDTSNSGSSRNVRKDINSSSKHRKKIEELSLVTDMRAMLHLPPLEPSTPNIGAAKTILQSGQKLAIQSLRESIRERRVVETDECLTERSTVSHPRVSMTENAIQDILQQQQLQNIISNAKDSAPLNMTPRKRSILLAPITPRVEIKSSLSKP